MQSNQGNNSLNPMMMTLMQNMIGAEAKKGESLHSHGKESQMPNLS
jgi:hypothetical protein